MSGKAFVDTNVLIYAHNLDAGAKREAARDLLDELWQERNGMLSLQVLQEFYVNVTRKIPVPLAKSAARLTVETYAAWCIETTAAEIFQAFRIEDEAQIGFWDALIVASAIKGRAERILSEDLNAGQRIAGVIIENPFAHAH